MLALHVLPLALALAAGLLGRQTVSFAADDGGEVCADLYGQASNAVVLAHGGRFNKESWRDQAATLVSAGFRVLALDFRGYGSHYFAILLYVA
jgi:pimeloyl-ACP methyl ester carboxylesterase